VIDTITGTAFIDGVPHEVNVTIELPDTPRAEDDRASGEWR
jgi:hypothetical protein